jgi:hypothetical protein
VGLHRQGRPQRLPRRQARQPLERVTPASLEDALEAPGITPAQFARQRANVWAQGEDAIIDSAAWDELERRATPRSRARPRWSWSSTPPTRDSAAVSKLWLQRRRRRRPSSSNARLGDGQPQGQRARPARARAHPGRRTIGQRVLREYIRREARLHREAGGDVYAVIFDPMFFGESAEILSDEDFELEEFPQTPARQIPASERTFDVIHDGRLAHDGDPVLRSQALNAGPRSTATSGASARANSNGHIDGFWAVAMGVRPPSRAPRAIGADWG